MSKRYTQQLNPLIFEAVDKLVDFVRPTYGPASNKVILQKGHLQEVIDDGVGTARDFELEDEFENAVVRLVKEVAIKTNDRVGDGTTSSLIILQALMQEIRKLPSYKARDIINDLKSGIEDFKAQITAQSRRITTKEELKRVAYISFNNMAIADIISEILFELGHEGIVTIEESKSLETSYTVTKGLQFPRGFVSAYFINDPQRAETKLQNPYILVTDKEIYDAKALVPLMNKVLPTGRSLMILADDVRGEALATLIVNYMKGVCLFPAVRAPYYSNEKYEFLMDVAALTGANFAAANINKDLKDIELEDLGTAESVIINKDHTTIVGGKGSDLENHVQKMKGMIDTIESDLKKDKMRERIARLTSGVAVIKVGGATENEMRALRYKVEDAVNATKIAFKSGVVPGAGTCLNTIVTSSVLLNEALKYPHKQLLENLELEELDIGEGVVDPVEVLIAGVESAVSIAGLLINTKGILVDKNEEPGKKTAMQ